MALSFLASKPPLSRPSLTADGGTEYFGGALTLWPEKTPEGRFVSRHLLKGNSPHTGKGRESVSTPPMHWHIHQEETLEVLSGTMCYVHAGKEGKAKKGDKVVLPPGKDHPHTFWRSTEDDEDLMIAATVTGGPNEGFCEDFISNFYGYLSSVTLAKQSPSLFQMLLFLDEADVVLSDPPFGLGRVLNVILGRWVGGYLLGYKTRYAEFDEEGKKAK
ncbi:hypothetical protein JCM6882_005873 [Rhodosporidiobolus microsporus]